MPFTEDANHLKNTLQQKVMPTFESGHSGWGVKGLHLDTDHLLGLIQMGEAKWSAYLVKAFCLAFS